MFPTLTARRPVFGDIRENGQVKRRKLEFSNVSRPNSRPIAVVANAAANHGHDAFPETRRILSRRYQLTRTGYKYLEIGITVGPPSYVDIALGDSQGREISFTLDTWKAFLERKPEMLSYMRSNVVVDGNFPSPITIDGDLTIRFGRINNLPILRLDSTSVRLAFSLSSLLVLFNHHCCVKHIAPSLEPILKDVDAKYSRFREITAAAAAAAEAKKEETPDPLQTIFDNENFSEDNMIDCELAQLFYRM
jgi:hypothetical protein